MEAATLKPWSPDRPVSRGATAYHNAVVNSSWHIENVNELARIVKDKIRDNDIVVDFGAGTGGSAIYLLKSIKSNFKLWLVDNSAAWLGKAYEILGNNQNVKCFLLEKTDERYTTLSETIGKGIANHVVSANTIHLIPDLGYAFSGIKDALKARGTFTFQSGNISRDGKEEGVLMIDDTVRRVHDISLEIVRANSKFAKYKKGLDDKIEAAAGQRKFVFPEPRNLKEYLNTLKSCGFSHEGIHFKLIKINYKDWLEFLRVKRLEAGILPEIGGKEPSLEEEQDRDNLITIAAKKLFEELKASNPLADSNGFIAEWVYIASVKN